MEVRELDVVRVVVLHALSRPVDGTAGLMRQPAINDVGTVVHVLSSDRVTVECVDSAGYTTWLADFALSELVLVAWSTREPRARFQPHGTLFVPARRELSIWGIILVGSLRPGMRLGFKLGNLAVSGAIEAVELVEVDCAPFIAVRVAVERPDELGIWRAMRTGEEGSELWAFD